MFPLGTVLLPGGLLPLHVFEARYLRMMADILDAGREFGVVLIERGSEVGGGDVRTEVGTVARIAEARPLPDGRWAIVAVGVERFRVVEWLVDDPYPCARVESWPDRPARADDVRWSSVEDLLRRTLGFRAELGEQTAPATVELSPDEVLRSYQAVALAGLSPFDRNRLLAAPGPNERLEALEVLLQDEVDVLRQLLETG